MSLAAIDTPTQPSVKSGRVDDCNNELFVEGCVQGTPVKFLIDTGSNITILKTSVWKQLPTPPDLDNVCVKMTLADGSTSPFVGRGKFDVQLGGNQTTTRVLWVADIEQDGILGLDVMRAIGVELLLKEDRCEVKIRSKQEEITRSEEEPQPCCRRVTVRKTLVVPPRSEVIVPGELDGHFETESIGILEPTEKLLKSNQLLLAKTVVDTGNPTIPVRLMNPTDEPRKIYQNTVVAICEPASEVVERNLMVSTCSLGTLDETADSWEIPDHLAVLYERSCKYLEPDQQRELGSLLTEYRNSFVKTSNDLGRTDLVEHKINTGDARPIKQPPRRLPMHKRAEADKHVEQMLKDGIIEPSSSAWVSPIVLVRKKDGSTRFCVDYRRLNDVTIKDSYPLPLAESCFDALSGSEWFSTLDLSSGYWQVAMAPEDREKTAFATGSGGLYQFTVMSFGLANAPATFERLMERVLAGLPWEVCLAYLDDIIIHARTFQEEMKRLRDVLERLKRAGLKLNPKKCHLFQKHVTFLGHVVSGEGISTDPEKVRAVKDWPIPVRVSEVRSFLGLCSYYRRFVKNFSTIARPLHRLTEKENNFKWTQECSDAFNHLKHALVTAPVLKYPSSTEQFILDTDASNYGIGAVLSQVQDGEERVVAYYSSTLSKAERNYCVTRKELLAIVSAVKKFHHYLYGRPFLIRTDHGALRWLLNFKNPEGQLARWIEVLGIYDLKIEHRSGVKHANADALSRRPCTDCKSCERKEQNEEREPCVLGIQLPAKDDSSPDSSNEEAAPTTMSEQSSESGTWVVGKSNGELRKAQLEDINLVKVINWKEKLQERPTWQDISSENVTVKSYWSQWDRLSLNDGILYRRWEEDNGKGFTWQLVVPRSLTTNILQELHNSKTAGHLGVTKTLGRIKQRYYWHRCSQDVKDWCRKCDLCAARKKPQKTPRGPMKKYNVGAPLERIALDILGPLPETNNSNKYILIVADYYTKWTEGYAIPNQEAETVARKVVDEFVARLGVPRQMHSDQGRNFVSAVFTEMCALLGIEKTRTTPLHPQSDGMVERYNRTLESMLAKFTAEHQRDWDEHLSLLMMAYRTSVHETTGHTPSMMMLGREAEVPLDLIMGTPLDASSTKNETSYVQALRERLDAVHGFAREHLRMETDRQKRYYDHRGVQHHVYNYGDPVWLYNPKRKKGRSPKLQNDLYEGPFLVLKRLDDLTYRIQKGARGKPKVVHHNRLKPYEGENVPRWLPQEKTNEGNAQEVDEGLHEDQSPLPSNTPGGVSKQQGKDGKAETPKEGQRMEDKSDTPQPPISSRPKRLRKQPNWMKDFDVDTSDE